MKITSVGRQLLAIGAATTLLTGCGGKGDTGSATPTSATTVSAAPVSESPSALPDNGVAALAPSVIASRAKAALKSAKSFRISGTANESGQRITIDFKISGADVIGTMRINKGTVQVLKVGGKQYMKPDAAFWKMTSGKQANTIIQVVGTRWAKVPTSSKDLSGLFEVTNVDNLMTSGGKLTKGPAKVIAGTPTISVVDHGKQPGTLYVATVGAPYPLRVDAVPASRGSVAFSEFGATFTDIKAPPAADVLDLAKLGH